MASLLFSPKILQIFGLGHVVASVKSESLKKQLKFQIKLD